jgi:hypothetical protein
MKSRRMAMASGYRPNCFTKGIGHRWAHNLEGYRAPGPQRFLDYYAQGAAAAAKPVAVASVQLR